ncbi:MAG: hypothetical protein WBX15_15545 [Thermoanaerobaculia bacterium]
MMTLETNPTNEEMRQVPQLSFIVDKLRIDFRRRAEHLLHLLESIPPGDSAGSEIERHLTRIAEEIERIASIAGRARFRNDVPLRQRVDRAFHAAIDSLSSLDSGSFRRRAAFHLMERSRGEVIFASVLVISFHFREALPLAMEIDPDSYEKLYENAANQSSVAASVPREPAAEAVIVAVKEY